MVLDSCCIQVLPSHLHKGVVPIVPYLKNLFVPDLDMEKEFHLVRLLLVCNRMVAAIRVLTDGVHERAVSIVRRIDEALILTAH